MSSNTPPCKIRLDRNIDQEMQMKVNPTSKWRSSHCVRDGEEWWQVDEEDEDEDGEKKNGKTDAALHSSSNATLSASPSVSSSSATAASNSSSSSATSSSSTSTATSDASPIDLSILPSSVTAALRCHDPNAVHDHVLARFLISAQKQHEFTPDQKKASSVQEVINAYREMDKSRRFLPEMFPHDYIRQFLQHADSRNRYEVENSGCSLLQMILYYWSINTKQHFSYDLLRLVLSTSNNRINIVDREGETALSSWCKDQFIRNGLVFHELIRAGANFEKLDVNNNSFLDHILSSDRLPDRLASLLSHEYALLCYLTLFSTSSSSSLVSIAPTRPSWFHPDSAAIPPSIVSPLQGASPIWHFSVKLTPSETTALRNYNSFYRADQLTSNSDFERQKLVRFMLKRWITVGRPKLRAELTETTEMATVCADLCLDYLDGSTRDAIAAVDSLPDPEFSTVVEASSQRNCDVF